MILEATKRLLLEQDPTAAEIAQAAGLDIGDLAPDLDPKATFKSVRGGLSSKVKRRLMGGTLKKQGYVLKKKHDDGSRDYESPEGHAVSVNPDGSARTTDAEGESVEIKPGRVGKLNTATKPARQKLAKKKAAQARDVAAKAQAKQKLGPKRAPPKKAEPEEPKKLSPTQYRFKHGKCPDGYHFKDGRCRKIRV